MRQIGKLHPRINPQYVRFKVRLGPSGIHRYGVYALEDIPARRVVMEYTGKIRTWGEASKIRFPHNIYLANLRRGLCVDGRIGGSGAEIVNHCCTPSLKFVRAHGHILLVSKRRIRAGEELTVDYHYPRKLRRVPCRCGARNCRKTFQVIVSR